MNTSEIMSHPVTTVRRGTSFKQVVDLLIEQDIGAVPVLDDQDRLVGIVAETDLITRPAHDGRVPGRLEAMRGRIGRRRGWGRKAGASCAEEIMTRRVVTARRDEPVAAVARRMMEHGVGRLPVMDGDRLVGIVARRDVLRPFNRPGEQIAEEIEARLNDHVNFERGHDVTVTVDDGVVTLTGSMEFPHDVRLLTSMVHAIAGVVHVDNRVQARLPEPSVTGGWNSIDLPDLHPM